MAKSFTDSKLVVLIKKTVFSCLEFLSFNLNSEMCLLVIYQDGTSIISPVMKGGEVVYTKHHQARMKQRKEVVNEQCINMVYMHIRSMTADGLTKHQQGKEFSRFIKQCLG